MKSNAIFMKFHTRLQSTDFVLVVLVLVPRTYKILIHEDEDEKNQIRSHAYALRPVLFSAFRIFSRGIVPSYRTTTGPTSEFLTPYTM